MHLSHLDHINIVVRDLPAAVAFFEDLGFVSTGITSLEGDWIETLVGLKDVKARFAALRLPNGPEDQTVFHLIEYAQPEPLDDPHISAPHAIGFRHVAFRVKDIEVWHANLNEKGVKIFSDVQMPQGLDGKYATKQFFYFLGPEGIIIELMEYA